MKIAKHLKLATKKLVTSHGIAAIPLSPFYEDSKQTGCIRLCFAKEEETLSRAFDRLKSVTY